MEVGGRDCEESGEEGRVAVIQSEAGTLSKLLLRWESQAAEGNAQQGPPPPVREGTGPGRACRPPGTATAPPLMPAGLPLPWEQGPAWRWALPVSGAKTQRARESIGTPWRSG